MRTFRHSTNETVRKRKIESARKKSTYQNVPLQVTAGLVPDMTSLQHAVSVRPPVTHARSSLPALKCGMYLAGTSTVSRDFGFLGRAFSRSHPDLGLPERITDWSDDHVIRALTDRSHDTVGNVIIGEGALRHFIESSATARRPIPLVNQGEAFDELAQVATEGQPAGSSAGGERPKFATYAETASGPSQVLVKFSPPCTNDVGQRWSDLLVCEAIAAEVLNDAGVMAVRA